MASKRPIIWIDTYRTKVPNSGLGQFSMRFAEYAVEKGSDEFQFEIFGWGAPEHLFADNAKKAKWHHRYLRSGSTADLWHSLYQLPSHKPPRNTKWLLTVHDLNFLYEKSPAKAAKYQKRLGAEVKKADYITCISEFTKGDLLKVFPQVGRKVSVIHNGVELQSNVVSQPLKGFNPEIPFFFSIGIFNPKKNFHLLVEVMLSFPDYHLVLAGDSSTSYGAEVKAEIEKYGLSRRVHLPGKISEGEKDWCYRNASAVLFPSFAEGFGMPPIEAMSVGTPVFLSRATSLPEIGGEVAYYFEKMTASSMAHKIKSGLDAFSKDANAAEKLKDRASKFTWDEAMKNYLDLYREILL
ncbi:glycosyltransferase family 4 protein [Phaeocystidibacter marisrubri]|uniref:Glycosyltransferase family 4 protein n=1 Tax=Phaeocystidibacter marisrubri TaxID=1577780 RepID=A0A6L3ZIH2_9FLAO|nr:glycosyltransferase family 1 protein [Phaeocystidibacter marisrubri]KAB2817275.1 glycosyltransferase family 4 protein [Phaeocystidibacter marisrubri]